MTNITTKMNGIDTKEITVAKTQATRALTYADSLEVVSPESYALALEEGKKIKTLLNNVEDRELAITKPLNEALKSTRALFKPIRDTLTNALDTVRSKMVLFAQQESLKAEAAKKKLAQKVESGFMKPETAMRKAEEIKEPEKTVRTETAQATMRTVKKYRIVNLRLVPLEFLQVDMTKVKTSFRAGHPVAGCEEYEVSELAIS